MQHEFFRLISKKHQQKIIKLAGKKGVSIETAMRNMVNYIEAQNCTIKSYFKGCITAAQVEQTIDLLSG